MKNEYLRFRENLRFQEISDWLKSREFLLIFCNKTTVKRCLLHKTTPTWPRKINFTRSRLDRTRVHLLKFKFWTPFLTILPMVCQVWLILFEDVVIILRALKEEVETDPAIINRFNLRLHRPNRYPKNRQSGLNGSTQRHSEKHLNNKHNSLACGWSPRRP